MKTATIKTLVNKQDKENVSIDLSLKGKNLE